MTVATEAVFTASWLEHVTGGRAYGDPHGDAFGTDSRSIPQGALFVALRGPNFDGHRFAATTLGLGATGVVVDEEWWNGSPQDVPALVVKDTLQALQDIAAAHRARFEVPVVAVTGSNGKTSTKEFVAAFLRPLGGVHKTQGNLNNHVGLPLTLLTLNPQHHASVVELGMNHAGEIKILAQLSRPRVAIITNIAAAHLEGVGDRRGVHRPEHFGLHGGVVFGPAGSAILACARLRTGR